MKRWVMVIGLGVVAGSPLPAIAQNPADDAPGITVLRPSANALVYHADPNGHFTIAGSVNGTPIRFLVDTGATLIVLTPSDARAAGIEPRDLVFDKVMYTANGTVPAAVTVLREVRVGRISLDEVRAAIVPKAPGSVLGMSFLSRLKSFEMQRDRLTLYW